MTEQISPIEKLIELTIKEVVRRDREAVHHEKHLTWTAEEYALLSDYATYIVRSGNATPPSLPSGDVKALTNEHRLQVRGALASTYLDMKSELSGLDYIFGGQEWFLDDLGFESHRRETREAKRARKEASETKSQKQASSK